MERSKFCRETLLNNSLTEKEMSKKLIVAALGVVALFMGLWIGASSYEQLTVEHLSYDVVGKIESQNANLKSSHKIAEIRNYPSFIIAQVHYENIEMEEAMNKAFHDLAGFIFGDNTAVDGSGSAKIPMTAPVITEEVAENSYKISFVMPAHYTLSTLPKPNNANIKIIQTVPTQMAAVSWKGAVPSVKTAEAEESELMTLLAENQYEHEGNMYLFEYDPPFTPSFMRNNEVLFKVNKVQTLTTEHLSYDVVGKIVSQDAKSNKFAEIRNYPSFIIAQVHYENIDMKAAGEKAFHELFGFISGDNTAADGSGSAKIPMTAPVITEEVAENSYKISFVMPAHYTLSTLPKPNNANIKIIQTVPTQMAAVSWKGAVPSVKTAEAEESELMTLLAENKYEHEGNMYLFEYDPPFTPNYMRNNEVLFQVSRM